MSRSRGQPTAYRPEFVEIVYKLALLMATDVEMADIFGVTEATLNNWKHKHPKFFESMNKGKLMADAEVAHKLRHRALGYSHEAVKIFMPHGASEPVYAPYIEHYPPDTQAASLWLRNRQPGKWRDRQTIEATVRHMDDPAQLTYEQLLAIVQGRQPEPLVIEHVADDSEGSGD